jgi:hypothetical protein
VIDAPAPNADEIRTTVHFSGTASSGHAAMSIVTTVRPTATGFHSAPPHTGVRSRTARVHESTGDRIGQRIRVFSHGSRSGRLDATDASQLDLGGFADGHDGPAARDDRHDNRRGNTTEYPDARVRSMHGRTPAVAVTGEHRPRRRALGLIVAAACVLGTALPARRSWATAS